MGLSVGKGSEVKPVEKTEKLNHKIVLDTVVVRERKYTVDIPVLEYKPKVVEYEKPVITEKETVKYNVKEVSTTRYNVKDEDTVKYHEIDVPVEKPVIVEKTYEKPVIIEVEYEKPIVKELIYEVHSVKNIDEIKEYNKEIREMNTQLPILMKHLKELREYRLVEQIIKVPKLEWETVKAERIEWVPVKREKPEVFDSKE